MKTDSTIQQKMFTALLRFIRLYVSPAEKSARHKFYTEEPESKIAWSTLKEEDRRYVVGVFYGATRPPRYRFYAVTKEDLIATPLSDASVYAPKN